jgi:DNA-binding MarR family transcriptional regulator
MTATTSRTLAAELLEELVPMVAHQRQAWASRCHAQGLSMSHFQVLSALELEGPLSMTHLADVLDVALPNATGIVGRMEERGLVERSHDESDRRVVLARLTADGRQTIGDIESARLARVAEIVEAMSPAEQADLLRGVRAMRAAMRRSRTIADPPNEMTELPSA